MIAAADVDSRIEELGRTVAMLQAAINAQPRVSLATVGPAPYLGQAVDLVATVSSRADSAPLPETPVTLITSWGVLREGGGAIEGTSISTVTAPDGTARVSLRPRLSLEDNEDQDALSAILSELDPAASTPADAVRVLQALAQQYRWEANLGYRRAVDAYFRDFGQNVLHAGPLRDYMAAWPLIPATVVAYAGEAGNTVAAATVTLQLRDWLGPWLQVYRQYARAQMQLAADLQYARQLAQSPAGLIAGVFDRAGTAVNAEFGEIGRNVAQQAAQDVIAGFLETGLKDLPLDTQLTVGPVLDTGSRALATAGPSVLSALGQTHAAAAAVSGTLAGKVDKAAFDTALATKANASDLVTVQNGLASKADQAAFAAFQTQTNNALNSKADLRALQAFQTQTTAALASKVDNTTFNDFRQTVINRLPVVITRADLDSLRASLQQAIDAKAEATAVAALQRQTTAALATKADANAITSIQNRLGTLEGRIR